VNEFSIIDKYFSWNTDSSIKVGVGDDSAVIEIESGYQIVTSVDTLIEGVHFSADTCAADIAYKSLAVNLSDLAAMGALPRYFTLALSMPQINESWLHEFSISLKSLALDYHINLVGGDTTKGPLSVTINVTGLIENGKAMLRSSANAGDSVFVSNTIGDAAYAWKQIKSNKACGIGALNRLNRPEPRVHLGRNLVGIASSCIDISDGLEQDLSHILHSSNVGAIIDIDCLPLSVEVRDYVQMTGDWCVALAGGDDYELCFSVGKGQKKKLNELQKGLGIKLTEVGIITPKKGLVVSGFSTKCKSYKHF